jgi:lipopolysaccharide export system protein LptA
MSFRSLRAVATALSLAIGLAAAMPLAHAEKADRNKPINYSADTGDVNIQTKVGTLTGNVVITQGTLTIHADKVVFRQNADNTLSATAHGNPVSFRQKRDGVEEYYEGFAQRGEYDGSKDLLQLYERALLRRGGDEIRSNYISYNTGTELFKAEGRASATPVAGEDNTGARVRGVFQPKGDAPGKADGKAAPAKAAAPAVSLKPAGEVAPSRSK